LISPAQTIHEVVKLENAAFDSSVKGLQRVLDQFLREDVKQMRDTKGYFNKISGDLDSALAKNAAASKGKPGDVDDASNVLTATRSCFRYTTLDYVYQISMLQSKKGHEVLEALVKYFDAYGDLFLRGVGLFDGDEFRQQGESLKSNISEMKAGSKALEKNLEKRHGYVSQNEVEVMEQRQRQQLQVGKGGTVEGYLFKRGQNAFRTWNRRWFYLLNNQLCYSKRTGEDVTVMEEDLRLCLVRPLHDTDRRFCFEVISPQKSHVLQADSEDVAKMWIDNLKQSISSAHHQTMVDDRPSDVVPGPTATGHWDDSDNEEDDKGGGGGASSGRVSSGRAANKGNRKRTAKQILLIPGK
jgi:Arf-GAP/coiled-coil/ANK repeat/PH domain-containing protein